MGKRGHTKKLKEKRRRRQVGYEITLRRRLHQYVRELRRIEEQESEEEYKPDYSAYTYWGAGRRHNKDFILKEIDKLSSELLEIELLGRKDV